MAARRDNTTVAVTGARPKREDCGRTKHDSAFSDWKALIGPSDWEDYSLGKEGSARYRVHNLPPSSSPGVYELGIAVTRTKSARETRKLNPSNIIIVYTGQADGVRTRLQQYGRSGAHLGNCSSTARANDDSQSTVSHKELGLFREILSRDYSIVFRWAPMNNKGDALGMEAELLKTFDYAWNKGSNGARRPHDILQKLEEASSTAYRVSRTSKKLLPFLQEKGGIRIHGRLPLDTKTVAHAEEENNFFNGIFKFNRSNPRVVLDRSCFNEDETGFCGVYLGNRNICKRPPVKGRKRCAEHKGMKVNARPWSEVPDQHGITDPGLKNLTFHVEKVKFGSVSLSAGESFTSCGFIMGDGSSCKRPPVQGRQRCSEHKGRRIVTLNSVSSRNQEINYVQNKGHNISENFQVGKLGLLYSSETCNVRSNTMTVCGVNYDDGTFCTRQPARGRVRCEYHKGMRVSRARNYVTR
ncbi:protein EFFECTOR OF TRANSCRIPTION 2 [Punica granatum]|uniref:Protein EFFECTOR OF TRANSCRIPTION 2 n=1 Tax=Punica granatum TaxID=22663 RepID=A0A6P8CKC4_PUNGR|nr:protein EFFECTOR OF TRANSCRIPTION 2 [Punica granatum]